MTKLLKVVLPAIVFVAASLASQPASAWVKFNNLYRCTIAGKSTLCYSAYTRTSDSIETCEIAAIRVTANALYGGGVMFTEGDIPYADIANLGVNLCHVVSVGKVDYAGYIRPCAPGGPAGWTHVSRHR